MHNMWYIQKWWWVELCSVFSHRWLENFCTLVIHTIMTTCQNIWQLKKKWHVSLSNKNNLRHMCVKSFPDTEFCEYILKMNVLFHIPNRFVHRIGHVISASFISWDKAVVVDCDACQSCLCPVYPASQWWASCKTALRRGGLSWCDGFLIVWELTFLFGVSLICLPRPLPLYWCMDLTLNSVRGPFGLQCHFLLLETRPLATLNSDENRITVGSMTVCLWFLKMSPSFEISSLGVCCHTQSLSMRNCEVTVERGTYISRFMGNSQHAFIM